VPLRDCELQIERADGSRIIVRADIEPLFDGRGSIVGVLNCFRDVTEQKREEEQRRASEQRVCDLLEALPAAVYTTDAAGYLTFYNRAAIDLAGRTPVLGVDRWCVTWRLCWPDGRPMPHDMCPMAVALKENRPVRGAEAVAERPDGKRIPILPYPTPLRDASGALIGAVNMLVDITARKEAEERQRLLLEELNHRVKNNMQMLYALLRTAQRETDNAAAKSVLMDVSRRMAAMACAQQVLYESDTPASFSAKDFLQSLCARHRPLLGGDVEIEIETASGDLPNDSAMPLALIANELLANAVKHGVNGNGNGHVKLGLSEGPDAFTLYVEDDGPGFDPGAGRKRSSGLGLVRGLSHQLGGSFDVVRTPGARCAVRFPRG
jgi:PAS domain S-box-containing protein